MSIKGKIFVGFIFFVIISVTILWLCQVVLFDAIYKEVKYNELNTTAKHILSHTGEAAFYKNIASSTKKNSICALVISADGTTVYTAENSPSCIIHSLSLSNIKSLVNSTVSEHNGKATFSITYDPVTSEYQVISVTSAYTLPEASSVVLVESFEHEGKELYLIIDSEITPVGTLAKTNASLLIVTAGLLVLIALLLASYISRTIAKPLVEINDKAKELALGNYEGCESETREIAELNETLIRASIDLKNVDRLRTELIANISHDLRTPLTLIKGYSEMMRDLPDEVTPDNLQIVIDETERLTSLVNDMLDISKIESGTLKPDISFFSITEAIETVLTRYSKFTEKDGYVIDFVKNSDVIVKADKTMIIQCICNLINNAMTYTGADKKVTVSQSVTDKLVRIEVSDSGEGIKPEMMKVVWDRYYKADSDHKRSANGSGLGLSIVRSIVKMHSGNYGVRSSKGKGSTFWFEIPYNCPTTEETPAS